MLRILLTVAVTTLVLTQSAFTGSWFVGELYGSYGSAALSNADFGAAQWLFTRARAAEPYNADWWYLEGVAAGRTRGYAASAPALTAALEREPNNVATLINAAEAYAMLGDTEAAKPLLRRLTRLTPNDWKLEHLQGVVAALDGRHAGAVTHLTRAARLAGKPEVAVLNLLANEQYAVGDYRAALDRADQALAQQPNNPDHMLIRAKALLRLGRHQAALREAERTMRGYRQQASRGLPVGLKLDQARRYATESAVLAGEYDRTAELFETMRNTSGESAIHDAAAALAGLSPDRVAKMPAALWASVIDTLIDCGDADLARDSLDEADGLDIQLTATAKALLQARLLVVSGDPDGAIEFLYAIQQRNTPQWRLALGEADAAAGRVASARLEFAALIGDATNPEYIRRRAARGLEALRTQ